MVVGPAIVAPARRPPAFVMVGLAAVAPSSFPRGPAVDRGSRAPATGAFSVMLGNGPRPPAFLWGRLRLGCLPRLPQARLLSRPLRSLIADCCGGGDRGRARTYSPAAAAAAMRGGCKRRGHCSSRS